ncbi:MAG: FAD-binding protein [Candidatus Thalassarchaeaceae archaeon]|jgi:succinate dehydrogenase/fumarate reductase flavoprotein subunit|nr:FAD-binding protein [Candidatus Thalassarchaeaceae archaeon]MDP7043893.1 FAD-binding protein [Candidatus Thalassarchaeaceae archaeon]
MDAWDVVVVGGTVAGLRAAISAHDSGAEVIVLEEGAIGSGGASTSVEGLAVSSNEENNTSHATDTLATGAGICDESTVRKRTGSAFNHLAEMERWGLVLRRASSGAPHLISGPGHNIARVATTGDTTGREIYSILQEQCMKRSIMRRGDTQALSLVTENNSVAGLVTLDVQRGELVAIQAKSIILATDGFESAWTGGSGGTGVWLAQDAGVELSNMEFTAWNPLCMDMHGLQFPFAILNDGASVRSASGDSVSFTSEGGMFSASQSLISLGEQCVLDARVLTRGSPAWYGDTSERVSSRLGGQMNETVIPISPRASTTLGGVTCDAMGSVPGISGLYAAGDCACSGFHGADMAVGNRLLESLDGGSNAGESAAEHADDAEFLGLDSMKSSLMDVATKYANLLEGDDSGQTRGQIENKLNKIMGESMGTTRNTATLSSAATQLSELSSTSISLSDESPVMNTELVEVFRLEGLVKVAHSAVLAAASREESCGSHQLSGTE